MASMEILGAKPERNWHRGAALGLLAVLLAAPGNAQYSEQQESRPLTSVDDYAITDYREPVAVEHYNIVADLDPETHEMKSKVEMRLQALETVSDITFELNENLFPTNVSSEDGNFLSAQRTSGLGLRVSLGRSLRRNETITITMELEGQFADAEYSPVPGVELAYVGEERSYLLYPARWFPVVGYGVNRYTAEMRFLVPPGYTVVSGGSAEAPVSVGSKVEHTFVFSRPTFPGSIAVVPQSPDVVQAEGLNMKVYFGEDLREMIRPYGEAAAQMVTFFRDKFGPPPSADLSIVEIDDRSLGGYAGPGVLFLSSRAIGTEVNTRLLAQEVAQQWWRVQVSPDSTADLWLDHGLATYSEVMYLEHLGGESALEERMREMNIEALIYDSIPLRAAGSRHTEFTAPYKSLLYDKAGAALHMLRWVMGDEAFFTTLRELANRYAFQTATTEDFENLASEASGQDLGPFFIQWMDSTGASNFTADYVVYRTEGGFRVSGRVEQDMDVFSMPVEVEIETEGEPVIQRVQVTGRASDFVIETPGRPKRVIVDPNNRVLKYNDNIRLRVAVARGEQAVAQRDYSLALEEYQKALDINRASSLAHYRVAEVFFILRNYQSAANSFREALNGDLEPSWTEVWSHISLGKIFDVTGQRDRAVNEYQQALRTRDESQGALDLANEYLQTPYERGQETGG